MIKRLLCSLLAVSSLAFTALPARADDYQDTVNVFHKAMDSGKFFNNAYGYAVFPTIGKGGAGVGGAYGKGRVYEKGKAIGEVSMTQLTLGFQLGGEGFSEIVFFESPAALKEFTKGEFAFGAEASAVAITAAAGAKTNTTGSSVSVSGTQNTAKVAGVYHNGMATFTVAKGGLMYEATVGGQKFKFTPK